MSEISTRDRIFNTSTTSSNQLSNAKAGSKKLSFTVNFGTNNQSLWKTGKAFSFVDNRFLGASWDNDKNLLNLNLPKKNKFSLFGSTNGNAGLQSKLKIQSGTIKASLPIDFWLSVPNNLKPGQNVTISSGFSLNKNASFNTFSPSASYSLDGVFNLNSSVRANYNQEENNLVNINLNRKKNLLSYNSTGASTSIDFGRFGYADINYPTINTQDNAKDGVLSSQGSDTFVNTNLDLDELLVTGLQASGNPIPPLQNSVKIELFRGVNITGSYNIFDAELQAELLLKQKFGLNLDSLTGQVILENGKKYNFTAGKNLTIQVPKNAGKNLDMKMVLNLKSKFNNTTSLATDVNAQVDLLQGSLSLNFPFNAKFKKNIGPLFSKQYNVFDGEVPVYNQTFALGGIQSQKLDFQIPLST